MPELEVHGVRNGDARALLSSAVRFKLDERVRDRIIAETRGNPLALLELPRGLTATQLAGGFGLVGRAGARGTDRGELRPAARDALRRRATSAAGRGGGAGRRSAAAVARRPSGSGSRSAAVDAEADGLLAIGERVTFRHPLVRSAVYRAATREQRRAVHLALAEATDRSVDPDRRAWHLATAAAGPDEPVAAALEQSAGRAQARGGLAAAAAFLHRSVVLSGDPDAAGAACACRCPSELARRQLRGRARASGVGRGLDARRAAGGACGAAPGSDRVRVEPGDRRAATALERRPTPRAARPRACARDLPRRVGSCAVRRSLGLRRQPGRGIPCRHVGSAADPARSVHPICCSMASPPSSPKDVRRPRHC